MTENIGHHGHDDQPEQLDDTHRDTDSELRREIEECIDATTRRPWFVALKSLPGEAGLWVGTEEDLMEELIKRTVQEQATSTSPQKSFLLAHERSSSRLRTSTGP